jgi:hypothetical protein
MSDRVYRGLDAMEPAAPAPVLDSAPSEPERAELRDRHHPVLPLRERRDRNRIGHAPEFARRCVTRVRAV